MKQLTEQQILDNYNQLIQIIKDEIGPERRDAVLKLYTDYEDVLMLAPAAGKESYHSCFPGGYVYHVLNVISAGLKMDTLWDECGQIKNYTREELIFALLNHDLGKIGMDGEPYYIPNPSKWHRENQGAIYTHNPKLQFMTVPDRGLFLLQSYGIECTFNEYISIKIHDGLYDDANKAYLISYSDDGKLRTNLPYIVAQADIVAFRVEYQEWKSTELDGEVKQVKGNTVAVKQMNTLSATPMKSESASKIFDDLFNK